MGRKIAEMTPKFFIFGFGERCGKIGREIFEFLEMGISGVVLFQRNCSDPIQLWSTLRNLVEFSNRKLMIAVDQEGGEASHLRDGFTIGISAMGIRAGNDPECAKRQAEVFSKELSTVGVNTIFAPVLDVNLPGNPVIGIRSFSDSPDDVVVYSSKFIEGLKKGKLKICVKHFPGHGPTRVDSHENLPRVWLKKEDYIKNHISIFKRVLDAVGYDMVMTAHVLHPEFDEKPGTLSKVFLTDILRNEFGFDGVIITDCLEMKAMSEVYGIEKATVESFKAGADLILLSHTPEYQMRAISALRDAVENHEIPESKVKKSLERLEEFIETLPEFPHDVTAVLNLKENVHFEDEISRRSIFHVSRCGDELPQLDGEDKFVMICFNVENNLLNMILKEMKSRDLRPVLIQPDPEKVVEMDHEFLMANIALIFTLVRSEQDVKRFKNMVHRIVEMKRNVIHVSLKNPYDLLEYEFVPQALATFGTTKTQISALMDVLTGKIHPSAIFPMRGAGI